LLAKDPAGDDGGSGADGCDARQVVKARLDIPADYRSSGL
jgi:hypothetical protein